MLEDSLLCRVLLLIRTINIILCVGTNNIFFLKQINLFRLSLLQLIFQVNRAKKKVQFLSKYVLQFKRMPGNAFLFWSQKEIITLSYSLDEATDNNWHIFSFFFFFEEETVSAALTLNEINKYYVKLHNKSIVCDGRRHIFLFKNIMKNWCLLLQKKKLQKIALFYNITTTLVIV